MLHDDGRFYAHGINSYKIDCGNYVFPDGIERVSYHIDWIDETTVANSGKNYVLLIGFKKAGDATCRRNSPVQNLNY